MLMYKHLGLIGSTYLFSYKPYSILSAACVFFTFVNFFFRFCVIQDIVLALFTAVDVYIAFMGLKQSYGCMWASYQF